MTPFFRIRMLLAVLFAALVVSACVAYVPAPAPATPSKYDQAWNAALGGVQDAGVTLKQADPASGLIRGSKDGIDVTVTVLRQGDGSVQVRFDSKGQTANDPKLPERFQQAYNRRMGR